MFILECIYDSFLRASFPPFCICTYAYIVALSFFFPHKLWLYSDSFATYYCLTMNEFKQSFYSMKDMYPAQCSSVFLLCCIKFSLSMKKSCLYWKCFGNAIMFLDRLDIIYDKRVFFLPLLICEETKILSHL